MQLQMYELIIYVQGGPKAGIQYYVYY